MTEQIIVIGAGIIGAAIAWHLAKRGAAVTVLEQSSPAAGASGGSFGWINANFAESPAYFALRRAAMDEYQTLVRQGEADVDLQCVGGLWWELTGGAFDHHHRMLAGYGYPLDKIDAAQLKALEPGIAATPAQCLYSKVERAVDAKICTGMFLKAAQQCGAKVKLHCRATGFMRDRGEVSGVQTPDAVLRADVVVVAAGASAQPLLAAAGVTLPTDNRTGLIVHTRPLERVVRHVVFAPEIHFWQRTDGVIVAGETFSGDHSGDNPAALADDIVRRLRRMLPKARNLETDRVVQKTRPMPADGFPALGAPAGINGLYVAAMHSGVTLAPLIGKLVAEEILENQPAELLAPFRPSRFAPTRKS